MKINQETKDFLTLTSGAYNRYSQFPVKYRLYSRDGSTLPSFWYITKQKKCPILTDTSFQINYKGTPTPEQQYILDIIRKRKEEYSYGCGFITLWTGKWKSHLVMQIASYFNIPALILCHNQKTVLEMEEKFKTFTDYEPWIYYATKKNIKPVTIVTMRSYIDSMNEFKKKSPFYGFPLIIHDECDYSLSKKMIEALCYSDAEYHYAMTGTPYTKDFSTEQLEKIFWKLIVVPETDKYNITPSQVFVHRYKASYQYVYENWAEQREQYLLNDHRTDFMIKLIEYYKEWRNCSLILTERRQEAQILKDKLEKNGHTVWLIHGDTKPDDDNILIEQLMKGDIKLLIGTNGKMQRWVDIPIIDTVFLFSPILFQWAVVQAVGRALRNHPDKSNVILIDFSDDESARQRYQRVSAYKKEYNLTPESIKIYRSPKHEK